MSRLEVPVLRTGGRIQGVQCLVARHVHCIVDHDRCVHAARPCLEAPLFLTGRPVYRVQGSVVTSGVHGDSVHRRGPPNLSIRFEAPPGAARASSSRHAPIGERSLSCVRCVASARSLTRVQSLAHVRSLVFDPSSVPEVAATPPSSAPAADEPVPEPFEDPVVLPRSAEDRRLTSKTIVSPLRKTLDRVLIIAPLTTVLDSRVRVIALVNRYQYTGSGLPVTVGGATGSPVPEDRILHVSVFHLARRRRRSTLLRADRRQPNAREQANASVRYLNFRLYRVKIPDSPQW